MMFLLIFICTYFLNLHNLSDPLDDNEDFRVSAQIENARSATSPITSPEDAENIKRKIVVNINSLGIDPDVMYYERLSTSGTIVIRNKYSRLKDHQKFLIYISKMSERKFVRLHFEHSGHEYDPSICLVTEKVSGFYSHEANIIFYALDLGSEFKIIQTPPNVVSFYLNHQTITKVMFLVRNDNSFYIYSTNNQGTSFKQLFRTVSSDFYHGWLKDVSDIFMTVKWNESTQKLDVVHVTQDESTVILRDCLSSKYEKNLYSASCMINGTINLYISKNGVDFRLCRFPNKLKIKKFRTIYMVDEMIFVSVNLNTSETNLYSGHYISSRNDKQLLFRRILTNVYVSNNDCESLYIHPVLLGMMIVSTRNKQMHSLTSHLISYNFGNTWNNIKSLTIVFKGKNYPCLENCRFNFYDCQYLTEHHQPNYSPWLILKYGYFHHPQLYQQRSLFVSRDAGLNWRSVVHGDSVFTYLDHGSIILVSHIHTTEIQFSVDECRTWIFFEVSKSLITVAIIIELDDANRMEAILIASNSGSTFVYHLDFSKLYTQACTSQDYETWTLMTPSGSCFLGEVHTFKYGKSNKLCETDENVVKNFESVNCKCSDSDFGCEYGFYLSNAKCIPDPDHVPEYNHHLQNNCTPGELVDVKLSRTHMVKMSHCLLESTKTVIQSVKELCNPIQKDNMLVIYNSSTIRIFNVAEGGKYNNELGLLVLLPANASDCILDFHTKTFYCIKKEQIYFYNYGFSDALNFKWQKFEKNIQAKQVEYDFDGQNLFVLLTTGKIYAINIATYMSLQIWNRNHAQDFKLYPHAGLMLIRTTDQGLYVSKMDGSDTKLIHKPGVMAYTFAAAEDIVLFTLSDNTNTNIRSLNVKLLFSEQKMDSKVLVDSPKHANDIEVVGSNLVVIENREIFVYNLKTKANYTKVIELLQIKKLASYNPALTGLKHCQHLECHGICIDAYDQASCHCMEGYTASGDSCICNEGHCNSECRTTEKQCDDGQCIHKSFWCDGTTHCVDGSDENSCAFKECGDDEFKCAFGNCIPIHLKCDGKNDCGDGSDEKCEMTTNYTCSENEFDCQDNLCIKKSLVCNNVTDCHNGYDEEDCKYTTCLLSQFKCISGLCIDSSFVCNNKIDCKEGEDENQNICGCTHFCFDGSCLNEKNICDSKKDCPSGEDEHNCEDENSTRKRFFVAFIIIIIILPVIACFSVSPLGKRIILRFKLILCNIDLFASNLRLRTRKNFTDEDQELLLEWL